MCKLYKSLLVPLTQRKKITSLVQHLGLQLVLVLQLLEYESFGHICGAVCCQRRCFEDTCFKHVKKSHSQLSLSLSPQPVLTLDQSSWRGLKSL